LSQKADHKELINLPSKSELHDLIYKFEKLQKEIQAKMDSRGKLHSYFNGL
jgi:hypothetical protein